MKAFVDRKACEGHGRCNWICPEVFDLDAEGYSVVKTPVVPPENVATTLEAALNCPEHAIRTEQGDS